MQRAAVKATETAKYWSSGDVKLLEIIAHYDPFKPPSYWRELSNELGDRVTVAVIEDAAHALFPEQPAQVAQVVLPWIASFRETSNTESDRRRPMSFG